MNPGHQLKSEDRARRSGKWYSRFASKFLKFTLCLKWVKESLTSLFSVNLFIFFLILQTVWRKWEDRDISTLPINRSNLNSLYNANYSINSKFSSYQRSSHPSLPKLASGYIGSLQNSRDYPFPEACHLRAGLPCATAGVILGGCQIVWLRITRSVFLVQSWAYWDSTLHTVQPSVTEPPTRPCLLYRLLRESGGISYCLALPTAANHLGKVPRKIPSQHSWAMGARNAASDSSF